MRNNYFDQLSRAYLITEIGVNHNGDLDLARKMVLEAKRVGARTGQSLRLVPLLRLLIDGCIWRIWVRDRSIIYG